MAESLRAAGFFLLRTPLLPLDTLTSWSDGLAVCGAPDGEIEAAVAADRARLRARLIALVEQPDVYEALASASPSLLDGLAKWRSSPDGEAGEKVERALVRYVTRMASRATPHQLLAGVSIGSASARTTLRLQSRVEYRRHTVIEASEVFRWADEMAADPALHAAVRFRPSNGLWTWHDEVRWFRRGEREGMRTWHATVQRRSRALDAVLARAAEGATLDELELAAKQAEPDRDAPVATWIEQGMLVHDLQPPLTGDDPLAWLASELAARGSSHLDRVEKTRRSIAALDGVALGASENARAPETPHQITLVKPVEQATLGTRAIAEIAVAVDALARLAPRAGDPFAKLREAATRRFDDLETPRFTSLCELLDPDGGVGLDGPQGPHAGRIAELELAGSAAAPVWTQRERFLQAKLAGALAAGETEIRLAPDELAAFPAPPLPDSLSAIASVAANADRPDDIRVIVHHVRANAMRLLARFSHVPGVRAALDGLVRDEAALHPDAVLAEVVHHAAGPVDLMGALHQRPVLRDYEIPLLARSGAAEDRQLPLDDLLASVGRDRVVLWSRRLRKRVIPKLSSAHRVDFRKGHVPAYRLLFAIENAGGGPPYLEWSWGPLAAPYLPRVTIGRAVLALAEWHLDANEVAALDRASPAARMLAVRRMRERRRLPRIVSIVDVERPTFDNVLYVDLDHSLAVDAFVHAAVTAGRAVLRELFAAPEQLLATGPEGRFVHELVVPFVRSSPRIEAMPVAATTTSRRAFPPGSEWLTLRVEAGMGRFDRLLLDHLVPAVRHALAAGDADRWFFLRLGLPVPQLRLRLHGESARLARPRAELEQRIADLVTRGEVFRAEWTTYEPETERYGGEVGISLAERIFEADSEAVVELIGALRDPCDEREREQLALVGVDRLLEDLGLALPGKVAVLEELCARWRSEYAVDAELDIRLGAMFRSERASLEALLAMPGEPYDAIWKRRSRRIQSVTRELSTASREGLLTLDVQDTAPSYAHMHCIRLAIRNSRVHELVVYDFLRRMYRSQLARQRR